MGGLDAWLPYFGAAENWKIWINHNNAIVENINAFENGRQMWHNA